MSFGLPEEVVLLGLDDATGKCVSSYANLAWNAAVLAELAIRGCIDVRGTTVTVQTAGGADGDEILNEALSTVRARPRALASAIRATLAQHGRDRTLQRLVTHGILEKIDNTVLGIFHFRRYPAHDGKLESEIRARLQSAVMKDEAADERTRTLLSIAEGCGLLTTFLTREERRDWAPRISHLVSGEPIGRALRKVIEEDEAALTTAAVIATAT